MLEVAQQLAYYVSFVDNGATSRLVQFGQQLASVAMIGSSVKASVESMLAPLNRIGAQWSQREQQINNITRSLRQYGYVGQSIADINAEINRSMPNATQAERSARFTEVYQQQFQQGRQMARGTIAAMTQLAATLPGEVDDYMQSFSMNLAHISKGRGMTLDRAAGLISQLTAGSIAAGIDSGQAARDLMQFLTVGPHITDRSWVEVWANYARDPRTGRRLQQADIGRMTTDQRINVLADIASQLGPLMNATGDSFDAIIGTLRSAKHELFLTLTEPIFNEFKNMISAVNGHLGIFMVRLGNAGEWIGNRLGQALHKATETVQDADLAIYKFGMFTFPRWVGNITSVGSMFQRNGRLLYEYFRPLVSGGGGLVRRQMDAHGLTTGNLATGAASMIAARYAGMLLGPWGALAAAILTRMFFNGQLNQTILAFGRAVAFLAPTLTALASVVYRTFDALSGMVGLLLSSVLPVLVTVLGTGLNFVIMMVTAAFNLLANLVLLVVYPIFAVVAVALAGFSMLMQIVSALFQALVGILGTGSTTTMDFIAALAWCTEQLDEFTRSLQRDANYLLHEVGLMSDAEYNASQASLALGERTTPKWVADFQKAITQITAATAQNGRAGNQPPQPRPHTSQDFRYSRFDITQRFAEGFDPDRVASAFADELAALSENRLESGFQPAFSTAG